MLVLAPLAVAFSFGIDRKLTARMQNRRGPSIFQEFYDVVKLLGKEPMLLTRVQAVFAGAALLFQAAALALFVSGGDLLVIFFVSGLGSACLVMGAFSVRSAYSYLGSQRELLQIFAYEPIFFLVVISIGLVSGTFLVGQVQGPILNALPLAFAAMIIVLVIKLEKSPYDIATAHQEIISGPYIEYSGPYLATLKIAHWFEVGTIYAVISLFFWSSNSAIAILGKVSLAFLAMFITVLVDNVTARLTRRRMVTFTMSIGTALIAIDLLLLFVFNGGHF